MIKERHISGNNWESLRAEIGNIIKEKKLAESDFKPLGIHESWKAIEENIYRTFCNVDDWKLKPIWLWEHLKLDTFSVVIEQPHKYLNKLIDRNEIVWFLVNGDKDKFWFYEAKVEAIMTVIQESSYIDEIYLVSKKYQWLICINHHDVLIATGETIPRKLKRLQTTIQINR